MTSLYRSLNARLVPVLEFTDAAAALAYVAKFYGETYTEEDADHPGCFDIFVHATGDVLAIQPTSFKL